MGMTEIIEVLEKNEELTSAQIAQLSKCSMTSVVRSLKRLLKDTEINVNVRVLTSEEKEKIYGSKIGSRIFIYKIGK